MPRVRDNTISAEHRSYSAAAFVLCAFYLALGLEPIVQIATFLRLRFRLCDHPSDWFSLDTIRFRGGIS
jgi:hypothetical protein